jgi:hypothetical protein
VAPACWRAKCGYRTGRARTRDAVLARVRQCMLELYEDDDNGEVGDADVCEQVAAALSTALVAHRQQEIIACDEILDQFNATTRLSVRVRAPREPSCVTF